MNPRHIPNIITVCRIVMVYPVIVLMLGGRLDWALILFIVAGVSDGVDGFLAKYYHWESRLGSFLDPVADKLLLVSSYVTLAWLGYLPVWLSSLVIARDIVIFSGAVAYYFLLRPFEGQPLFISKLNTLVQIFLVFLVLVHHALIPLSEAFLDILIGLVALTTLASGAQYVYTWGTSFLRESRVSRQSRP